MLLQVERRRIDADERHPKVREDLVRGIRFIVRQSWHLKAGSVIYLLLFFFVVLFITCLRLDKLVPIPV